jgi:hypothetical protein
VAEGQESEEKKDFSAARKAGMDLPGGILGQEPDLAS